VRPESSDYRDEAETPKLVDANDGETQLLLPERATSTQASSQWQQYGEQIGAFLRELPSYVTRFFDQNRGPLGTIALIVGSLLAVKVTFALLDALDDIPLVAPTLELIGLAYTIWFVYRYLLRAENRQELSQEVNTLKEQVLGSGK
jgi:hypothetical protein